MNTKANPLVYVVDDEPEICDSLKMLLGSVGLRVEAFTSGTDFLARADLAAGDCLVADVRMPGIGGLELQEQLRTDGIPLPVIIITGHGDVAMGFRLAYLPTGTKTRRPPPSPPSSCFLSSPPRRSRRSPPRSSP